MVNIINDGFCVIRPLSSLLFPKKDPWFRNNVINLASPQLYPSNRPNWKTIRVYVDILLKPTELWEIHCPFASEPASLQAELIFDDRTLEEIGNWNAAMVSDQWYASHMMGLMLHCMIRFDTPMKWYMMWSLRNTIQCRKWMYLLGEKLQYDAAWYTFVND